MTILLTLIVLTVTPSPALPGADDYLAGTLAQDARRLPEAAQAFTRCAAAGGPLAPWAKVQAARCQAQGGDFVGGAAALQAVITGELEGPWTRYAKAELGMFLTGRRQYITAAPLLDSALTVQAGASVVKSYRWSRADAMAGDPATSRRGFELLAEMLTSATQTQERTDIANRLADSPLVDHRITAAITLLDSAQLTGSHGLVKWLRAAQGFTPEQSLMARLVDACLMMGARDPEPARAALRAIATEDKGGRAGRLAEASLIREALRDPLRAAATLDAYAAYLAAYQGRVETGDMIWWRARSLRDAGKMSEAAGAYEDLVRVCPQHPRADLAAELAGDAFRTSGDAPSALRNYLTLIAQYPLSSRMSEAAYRAAGILEAANDRAKAAELYLRAAKGALGDYYTHRALEHLAAMGSDAGLAGNVMPGGTGPELLRPRKEIVPEPVFPTDWETAPWAMRLRFFGANGLPELEWEALALVQTAKENPAIGSLLVYIGRAGAGGMAMLTADELNYGETGAGNTPERMLIDFPLAYWETAHALGKETGVDPFLILSIARQESRFRARAVSRSGASGVMQLMPKTARWMAEVEPGISPDHAGALTIPENSIRLGAFYLRRMLSDFDGNTALALAAYNGGPGNVRKWLRATSSVDLEAFVDAIPFEETKDYVRKVLGNYAAYYSLYGAVR